MRMGSPWLRDVLSVKTIPLGLAMTLVLSLVVGTHRAAVSLSFRLPEKEEDFIEVVDETEGEPEWKMILKGSLTLKTPDETGTEDLYHLTISFPPEIKRPFKELPLGAYAGLGTFLTSGFPGTIMVAVEEDKAFFGADQKLFFKETARGDTSGPIYCFTDIKKEYTEEEKKYGVPYKPPDPRSIWDDLWDAAKVTASFALGVTRVGPFLGFVQMVTAFKGVEEEDIVLRHRLSL
jgi:hypothetical protein